MNLRKILERPGHLEKYTEAERLQKQVALHIRQVQAGDTGERVGGHTETRLLGGRTVKFLVARGKETKYFWLRKKKGFSGFLPGELFHSWRNVQ